MAKDAIVEALLEQYGETFAEEAGIALDDKPAPLFQLLVLSILCGAPVRVAAAVRAARALFEHGWTTPEKMARVTTARRAKVLREAGYARFIGRAATATGDAAKILIKSYGGDLRNVRAEATDADSLRGALKAFPGVGDTAVDVFFCEVQELWPEVAPFAGARALEAARALGLGSSPAALAGQGRSMALIGAALTRCALADDAAGVRAASRATSRARSGAAG